MSIAYTGMDKSLRHKGYHTQNIKCFKNQSETKRENKRWSRHVWAAPSIWKSAGIPEDHSMSTALSIPTLWGVLNASSDPNAFSKCWIGSQLCKVFLEFEDKLFLSPLNLWKGPKPRWKKSKYKLAIRVFRRPATAWLPWDQKGNKKMSQLF